MLIKKRKITEVEEFKKNIGNFTIKKLGLHFHIPYQFLDKYKDNEDKLIRFIIKILKYRDNGFSNDPEVIEANKYYTTYFL